SGALARDLFALLLLRLREQILGPIEHDGGKLAGRSRFRLFVALGDPSDLVGDAFGLALRVHEHCRRENRPHLPAAVNEPLAPVPAGGRGARGRGEPAPTRAGGPGEDGGPPPAPPALKAGGGAGQVPPRGALRFPRARARPRGTPQGPEGGRPVRAQALRVEL